ncbi:hypothetical protein [Streptomyces sp. NPDC051572]|uniref:hypothetical protein n=1 Tax=Streptomyces sp. NPDC051572 TaxID=3155802 RepID=UPI00344DAA6A
MSERTVPCAAPPPPAEQVHPLLRALGGDDLGKNAVQAVDLGARRAVRAERTAGLSPTPVQHVDRSGHVQCVHDRLPRGGVRHDLDGGLLDPDGRCGECGSAVPVPEIRIEPGPGFQAPDREGDPVSSAINTPRRLLDPIVASPAPGRQDGPGADGRTKPRPSGDRTVAPDATTGCRGGMSNWA